MAEEICPKCGLPKSLCICGEIEKESEIKISALKKRYGKMVTIVHGINKKELNSLSKKLKQKLACGGTVKNDTIVLQGDHRNKLKDILVSFGYKKDAIIMS